MDIDVAGSGKVRRPYKTRHDRRLSEEHVALVCEMRERGKSLGTIRNALAVKGVEISESAISYYCLINGADLPPERRQPSRATPGMVIPRGNHVVRRFTEEEDETLRRMELSGCSYSAIAKHLKRPRNSITGRLATLARLDARAEETMQ